MKAKEKLESIQIAYSTLKSECIQNLKYFETEIMEKYNEGVIHKIKILHNEELENRQKTLIKLYEEIDREYII